MKAYNAQLQAAHVQYYWTDIDWFNRSYLYLYYKKLTYSHQAIFHSLVDYQGKHDATAIVYDSMQTGEGIDRYPIPTHTHIQLNIQ